MLALLDLEIQRDGISCGAHKDSIDVGPEKSTQAVVEGSGTGAIAIHEARWIGPYYALLAITKTAES